MLTLYSIERMGPGQDLDEAVAEWVMGWRKITTVWGDPIADGWTGYFDGQWPRWIVAGAPETPLWRPSTTLSDAWEVVERLRHHPIHPYHLRLDAYANNRHGLVRAVFYNIDDGQPMLGQTPEHAICLAALAAIVVND